MLCMLLFSNYVWPYDGLVKMRMGRNMLSIDYILITNLMHWLLFIHKILFSSISFEPQVLICRRIQLYTCSIWYCHSVWGLWWPVGTQFEWELTVGGRLLVGVLRNPPTTFPLVCTVLNCMLCYTFVCNTVCTFKCYFCTKTVDNTCIGSKHLA